MRIKSEVKNCAESARLGGTDVMVTRGSAHVSESERSAVAVRTREGGWIPFKYLMMFFKVKGKLRC